MTSTIRKPPGVHVPRSILTLAATLSLLAAIDTYAQTGASTTVGGFADVYYAYSMLAPPSRTRSYTTQPLRHNEFNLNLGVVEIRHAAESVRGRFALQTGTYVESNLAAEPELLKHVLEASAGTRLSEGVWIDLGVFPSHIGLEGILSKDNWTYSRSLLADYSPYYEAGLSLTAALSGKLTVRGLVLNGWQNIRETNNDKAVGTQVQYTSGGGLLLNWSSFVGNEQPDSVAARLRIFNDLYAVWSPSAAWAVALVVDVGVQERAGASTYDVWHGASLMARWAFANQWAVAGRGEYFSDPEGVLIPTGTPGNFRTAGGSVNLDYAASPSILWRLETRILHSKEPIYPSDKGVESTEVFVALSAALSL